MKLDINKIRADFPIFTKHPKLAYLDNAATSQKPQQVIDAVTTFYTDQNSNIHRGVYTLSQEATDTYEGVRAKVAKFINAHSANEIVFVRGATEAINLVAQTFGRVNVGEGDEVLITEMEHHSNIVPWQILCEEKGAKLKVAPMNDNGELIVEEFEKLLSDKTKLVALVHVSNSLGTVNPVSELVKAAHEVGAKVLIDGAQAVPHLKVDVQAIDADFYAFSGHKMYGPTGIGVLYAKEELLNEMPPYQGGGEMIVSVKLEKSEYKIGPHKFEAGTPNIAGTIGLGAAIDYLSELGLENIATAERELLSYATEKLKAIDGLKIIGTVFMLDQRYE